MRRIGVALLIWSGFVLGLASCGDAVRSDPDRERIVNSHIRSLLSPDGSIVVGSYGVDGVTLDFWVGRNLDGGIVDAVRQREEDGTEHLTVGLAGGVRSMEWRPESNRVAEFPMVGDLQGVFEASSPLTIPATVAGDCAFRLASDESTEKWECREGYEVFAVASLPNDGLMPVTMTFPLMRAPFDGLTLTFTKVLDRDEIGVFDLVAVYKGATTVGEVWRP